MANFIINLGTLTLADNPNGIAVEDINFQIAKNIEESALPKSDGAVIPIGSRKDIVAKVKGTLVGTSYTDARGKMDNFLNTIESASEQKLTVDNERYLLVQYRNFAESYRSKNNFIDFSFDVVASYPFWLTVALQRSTPAWTSGNLFKATNNGNAKTRAKIILTAVGGSITDDIKLENLSTGEVVQYRGTLNSGKILTINNRVDSGLVKFGAGSLALYGADYLSTPDSPDFDFSGGIWTVDFWIYPTFINTNHLLWGQFTDGNNYMVCYLNSAGTIVFTVVSGGVTIISPQTTGPAVVVNAWQHIAIVENGNSYQIFVSGNDQTSSGGTNVNRPANYSGVFEIGGSPTPFFPYFLGYIDEFRVSLGTARWGPGNFTPPTSEYSADGQTKLLLHMNGNPKATTFLDVSSSMHVMAANGNAMVQNDSFLDSGEVLNAGTSDITNLNGDFLTLIPGDNYIKLTCGQSTAILSIEYREAYK